MAARRLGRALRPTGRAHDEERRSPLVPVHGRYREGSYRAVGNSRAAQGAGTICPFVFHRNGERIGYFRSAWKNACKAAGCPRALVHDMRRSAVRTFERAGVPRSVAMSIVGHKTESIYRRYAIVDEAMQREAAARLDAWVAAPPAAASTATVTALRRGSRLRGRVTG
jgi:integrase